MFLMALYWKIYWKISLAQEDQRGNKSQGTQWFSQVKREIMLCHGRWSEVRDLYGAVGMPALHSASQRYNHCKTQLATFLRPLLFFFLFPHTSFIFTQNSANISLHFWIPLGSKLPGFVLLFEGNLVLWLGFLLPEGSHIIHPCCPQATQLVTFCLPLEAEVIAILLLVGPVFNMHSPYFNVNTALFLS